MLKIQGLTQGQDPLFSSSTSEVRDETILKVTLPILPETESHLRRPDYYSLGEVAVGLDEPINQAITEIAGSIILQNTTWTPAATKLLVALYEEDLKNGLSDKGRWKRITSKLCEKGYSFTTIQCKDKLGAMKASGHCKKSILWTPAATKLLVELYEEDLKNGLSDKGRWKRITSKLCEKGYSFTTIQCKKKLETVKQPKKHTQLTS